MKIIFPAKPNRALTLVEALVVIAVVAVLGIMILYGLSNRRSKPLSLVCLNNLKQINIGFLLWANDNEGKLPMQLSTLQGGTLEFAYADYVFPHFRKLSPYMIWPSAYRCPLDETRKAVTNYEELYDKNISYFLSADASTNQPAVTILDGDRNLQVEEAAVKGSFILTTNQAVSWTGELHKSSGHLGFADGHVQRVKTNELKRFFEAQGLATNRLLVP